MAMVTVLLAPRSPEDLAVMEGSVRAQELSGWECHVLPRSDGAAVRAWKPHVAMAAPTRSTNTPSDATRA